MEPCYHFSSAQTIPFAQCKRKIPGLGAGAALAFDDLTTHLRAHEIAKFKLPERLEIFTRFPLSTFGKVSKKDLTRMVAERVREGSAAN